MEKEKEIEKEILTVDETAEFLRCHRDTLKKQVDSGEIPCFNFGGKTLFRRSSLDAWIKEKEKRKQVEKANKELIDAVIRPRKAKWA